MVYVGVLVGAILVVSGLAKVRTHAHVRSAISGLEIVPAGAAGPLAAAVTAAEVVVGATVLATVGTSNTLAVVANVGAVVIFSGSMLVAAWAAARKVPCGWFMSTSRATWWATASAFVLGLASMMHTWATTDGGWGWASWISCAALTLAGTYTALPVYESLQQRRPPRIEAAP